MSTPLNLDEARARRAEANKDLTPPELQVAGETFTFPASVDDIDFDDIAHFNAGRVEEGLTALFGPDDWERFRKAAKPTAGDINDIVDWLLGEYGLGESSASSVS